ncbi:uncharacterized protein PRCAT00005213001 [Priceomyces carsonii]|uniref:uncharacterized protein n=1 Tax=Priceomyces carsonii TaxID=28549 RepID=UPI002EDB8C87|nr:unnamed protein product [Priceomyces carsonii]
MVTDAKIDTGKATKRNPGPIYSKEGIPYDYIVIIDSGSKGSRVFIYNWLNPTHAINAGIDFDNVKLSLKLLKRAGTGDEIDFNDKTDEGGSDSDSDSEGATSSKDKDSKKQKSVQGSKGKLNDKDKQKEKSKDKAKGQTKLEKVKFPKIYSKKKWHQKIRPGISSFNASPQKIGNHHLKYLLSVASTVVPKSQHTRTPIFLHSTAGMRLLNNLEQQQILENICSYFTYNSDFYMPDCASHVNVIDGDVEGLYGWLSINYLVGALDSPEKHKHGKNHTTYGLLDMGGSSTQVVFLPNSTEINEHKNNLYKISLAEVPQLQRNDKQKDASYSPPVRQQFDVYSDSFLGLGMFQAHDKYLTYLADDYREDNKIDDEYSIGVPVSDPCLPKGNTKNSVIKGDYVDFVGESDFQKCLTSIFPVLLRSTYGSGKSHDDKNCKQLNEGADVSACLLNDLIPAFDFDVNHFIGVSGYWDAINTLLSYGNKDQKPERNASDEFDYKVIYQKTKDICSMTFSQLIDLNKLEPTKRQLTEVELSELCFKSSWILNFLHTGLGFPRYGIDKDPNKNKQFKSLQLAEDIGGSVFSWTLGRAILYSNDEYIQAFINHTIEVHKLTDEKLQKLLKAKGLLLQRPGYYHSASSMVYSYGAEQNNIPPRPQFRDPDENAVYHYYDYELSDQYENNELKWYVQPHRWYGLFIFMFLIGFIVWLMVGRGGRSMVAAKLQSKFKRIIDFIKTITSKRTDRYTNLPELSADLEDGHLELTDFEINNFEIDNSLEDLFKIDRE